MGRDKYVSLLTCSYLYWKYKIVRPQVLVTSIGIISAVCFKLKFQCQDHYISDTEDTDDINILVLKRAIKNC